MIKYFSLESRINRLEVKLSKVSAKRVLEYKKSGSPDKVLKLKKEEHKLIDQIHKLN